LILCFSRYNKSGFIKWYFVGSFGVSNFTTEHKLCCRFNGSEWIDYQPQNRVRGWIENGTPFDNIGGNRLAIYAKGSKEETLEGQFLADYDETLWVLDERRALQINGVSTLIFIEVEPM
jgi:hypothetical protein